MKYKTKPVIVEAMQWNGHLDNDALRNFVGHWVSIADDIVTITTFNHVEFLYPGCYVVRTESGEYRVWGKKNFLAAHEEVSE